MSIDGSTIRRLRTSAGLTQKKLAAIAGVSQAHIAKIEQGKVDPRLSTVNRIMNALKGGKEHVCRDIMTRGVITVRSDESILKASEVMVRNAVSQLPILTRDRLIGTITEQGIVRNLRSNLAHEKVTKVMDLPMPELQENCNVEVVRTMLEKAPGVLIRKGRDIVGIITRSDLLKTIE